MLLFWFCTQLNVNWMGIVLMLFLGLMVALWDGLLWLWLWMVFFLLMNDFVVLLRLLVAGLFLMWC